MTKTVLIVDDSPSVRQMVRKTLAGAGYQVIEAGDGEQALAELDRTRPDAILTDQNMRRMDGPSFLRNCRHLRREGCRWTTICQNCRRLLR
ncbi:response regulator [Rhodovulum sp.]|uniref:response regulator n=1 Tax=Rhodovulum sp. TaxID=34009 RepID=UPI001844BDD0|nr:response regulator [Rhodovulum sp.]HDR27924.1 response regulator [Rhodovulum sp.]